MLSQQLNFILFFFMTDVKSSQTTNFYYIHFFYIHFTFYKHWTTHGSLNMYFDGWKVEKAAPYGLRLPKGVLGPAVFSCHAHLAPTIELSSAKGLSLLQGFGKIWEEEMKKL